MSLYAWTKLLYLRDLGATEVGGFAITKKDDLLYIVDIKMPKQQCSGAFVSFDDDAVSDHFDDSVDAGLTPEQFGRIWIHTHPANSASPSGTDEDTFDEAFGKCSWSVMFILARGGEIYARIQFAAGPGAAFMVDVELDVDSDAATDADKVAWKAEYDAKVTPMHSVTRVYPSYTSELKKETGTSASVSTQRQSRTAAGIDDTGIWRRGLEHAAGQLDVATLRQQFLLLLESGELSEPEKLRWTSEIEDAEQIESDAFWEEVEQLNNEMYMDEYTKEEQRVYGHGDVNTDQRGSDDDYRRSYGDWDDEHTGWKSG